METNCHKYKRKTIGVLLEWFLTTRTAAITPRISIFTLSLLKIRAVFLMFPNVCLLISRRWKKISTNNFRHFKLHPWESLSLKYDRNRTKLRYWKLVASEKCTPEIGELSSVKSLFWVNHASKKTQKVLNGNHLDGLMSLRRWIDYIWSFQRTEEEMSKKRPK